MTVDQAVPPFDHPQLARAIEALPGEFVDALPFGAIRLDEDGRVLFYSEAERRLSGYGARPVVDHNFFAAIAPCMDNPQFRGRIEAARQSGKLDLEFTHIGDFEDRDRELTVRIQSASDAGYWIFIRRED
jgi:photoactive yellow protein